MIFQAFSRTTPPHLKKKQGGCQTTPPHLKKFEAVLRPPHLEGGVVEVIYNPAPGACRSKKSHKSYIYLHFPAYPSGILSISIVTSWLLRLSFDFIWISRRQGATGGTILTGSFRTGTSLKKFSCCFFAILKTWKRSSRFWRRSFVGLPIVVGFDAGMGGSTVNWRYGARSRRAGLIRITSCTILDEVDDWTGL